MTKVNTHLFNSLFNTKIEDKEYSDESIVKLKNLIESYRLNNTNELLLKQEIGAIFGISFNKVTQGFKNQDIANKLTRIFEKNEIYSLSRQKALTTSIHLEAIKNEDSFLDSPRIKNKSEINEFLKNSILPEMELKNISAMKLSKKEYPFLPYSLIVKQTGEYFFIKDQIAEGGIKKIKLIETPQEEKGVLGIIKDESSLNEEYVKNNINFYQTFENSENHLSNGWVLKWKSASTGKEKIAIVSRLHPTDLEKLLGSSKPLREDIKLNLMSNLSEALLALHSKNWTHRDIKASNIFVDYDENHPEKSEAFLADFDCAVEFKDNESKFPEGTLSARAPELLTGKQVNFEKQATSEIWSLGKVFYEIYYGVQPDWKWNHLTEDTFLKRFFNNNIPQTHTIDRLIYDMLNFNPKKRPSLEKINTTIQDLKSEVKLEVSQHTPLNEPYIETIKNNKFEIIDDITHPQSKASKPGYLHQDQLKRLICDEEGNVKDFLIKCGLDPHLKVIEISKEHSKVGQFFKVKLNNDTFLLVKAFKRGIEERDNTNELLTSFEVTIRSKNKRNELNNIVYLYELKKFEPAEIKTQIEEQPIKSFFEDSSNKLNMQERKEKLASQLNRGIEKREKPIIKSADKTISEEGTIELEEKIRQLEIDLAETELKIKEQAELRKASEQLINRFKHDKNFLEYCKNSDLYDFKIIELRKLLEEKDKVKQVQNNGDKYLNLINNLEQDIRQLYISLIPIKRSLEKNKNYFEEKEKFLSLNHHLKSINDTLMTKGGLLDQRDALKLELRSELKKINQNKKIKISKSPLKIGGKEGSKRVLKELKGRFNRNISNVYVKREDVIQKELEELDKIMLEETGRNLIIFPPLKENEIIKNSEENVIKDIQIDVEVPKEEIKKQVFNDEGIPEPPPYMPQKKDTSNHYSNKKRVAQEKKVAAISNKLELLKSKIKEESENRKLAEKIIKKYENDKDVMAIKNNKVEFVKLYNKLIFLLEEKDELIFLKIDDQGLNLIKKNINETFNQLININKKLGSNPLFEEKYNEYLKASEIYETSKKIADQGGLYDQIKILNDQLFKEETILKHFKELNKAELSQKNLIKKDEELLLNELKKRVKLKKEELYSNDLNAIKPRKEIVEKELKELEETLTQDIFKEPTKEERFSFELTPKHLKQKSFAPKKIL